MKRLLVVSDPPAAPGFLPRLRYMCDFLMQKGHSVTLLTEEYQPLEFAHQYDIITIPMYRGTTIDWMIKSIWTLLTDWHNTAFAKKAIQLLNDQIFDAVICTSFSDFPLGAAQQIASYYHIPLLCDIRDLDEQVENSTYQYHHQNRFLMLFRRLYRTIHIRRRNNVLRTADIVTTVSPWHKAFIAQFNTNVHIIYNGYDENQFYPKDIITDAFKITYIGSLFEWQKSAMQTVQRAIKELGLPISLDVHTPKDNPIHHENLGDAIRQSSMMLVCTSPNTHGMLTTKFYEALGCKKPILCVPSDLGSLADLINYTNAGIATDDIETIKSFITTNYNQWTKNGYTRQNTLHHEEFSRRAQCEQLERIINTHLHD
ncbi:MAG: glycosyltransferase [Paludibacteraceae bacterium]|nr:glycosyltransferase [Paludibacteraceae bacterium]